MKYYLFLMKNQIIFHSYPLLTIKIYTSTCKIKTKTKYSYKIERIQPFPFSMIQDKVQRKKQTYTSIFYIYNFLIMKNVKILATLVVLPILGMVSYVHADYDCSTVDREAIKTLLDKQASGTQLTSDETATLESAASCRPVEGSGSTMRERKMRFGSGQTMTEKTGTGMMMRNHDNKFGSGQTLTDEQKNQMEQIKALRDKQKNGETLTTEEQAILDAHQAQMKENTQEKKQENRQQKATTKTKLSNAYQKAIDNKVENLVGNYSTKDDKINALNAF